uniref:PH domain-containing protein n=1 Tax=Oryza punctata TaxID=4537 RepID=A0A0E0JD40_ORYPU
MEFPHRHHHHHHDDDDDDNDRRRPPAHAYGQAPPPADPYARHPPSHSYGRNDDYAPPPPAYGAPAYGYGGGGYGNVVHVSHEVSDHQRPPVHGGGGAPPPPTHRIYCKAGEDNYSLAVRDGKVCLVRSDRDDHTQHWVKDMKYSTRVKDEEGYPAMALVNKATGEALKHSIGQSHPCSKSSMDGQVRLARYNPEYMDESVLWTESRDVGSGFRCIRMVNNIYLNFDALHGDKDHGGVRDGTTLVLWEWCEGDNQRWKIVPWSKSIYLSISTYE